MAHIYHDPQNNKGGRALVWLVCDGCDKRIKPGAAEMPNWVKKGLYHGPGDSRNQEWLYCATCHHRSQGEQ